jgi:hypothetical protein
MEPEDTFVYLARTIRRYLYIVVPREELVDAVSAIANGAKLSPIIARRHTKDGSELVSLSIISRYKVYDRQILVTDSDGAKIVVNLSEHVTYEAA